MIEILHARALVGQSQSLFVFDEPGGPLHPAGERAMVPLLDELARSSGNQVIYTTHSPFLLDWSFPQRVRLFHRGGRPHLDFPRVAIVPSGDLRVLGRLLDEVERTGSIAAVLIDTDRQGDQVEKLCHRRSVPTLRQDQFSDRGPGQPAAIEDVVGVREYLAHVNAVYRERAWFRPIEGCDAAYDGVSLGR
jgi:hypothetical protein